MPSARAALGALALVAVPGCSLGALPATRAPPRESTSSIEQTAIEQQEICVGSAVASAGDLGDTLYYRATRLPDGKLVVGYFAFFSDERPWGDNWLTWTLVPALAIDLVYTRAAFVAPGLQRAISGKGDVEGFRVVYELLPDGSLEVDHAIADDASHAPVRLEASDVLRIDAGRPTFYSDVWSHQLGARGVRRRSALAYVRCFGGKESASRLLPLPDAVADDFALRGRALPAHVEALGGRAIGSPPTTQARAGY